MTPPINDLSDLWLRAREIADELLFGPADPSKSAAPAAKDPKIQKAKDEAEKRRAVELIQQHQRLLLKKLEEYKQQIKSGQAEHAAEENPSLWDSIRSHVEVGVLAFCPWILPMQEVAKAFPPLHPFGLDFSAESIISGLHEMNRQAGENRKRWEQSLEGAVWNPTSLEDIKNGNLFVIEEDALNEIVSKMIATGPAANKVKNVHIQIDGDELKIKGEYNTGLLWVGFSAKLELEQKNGETSGSLRKIEAAGFDLGDYFKKDILNAFKNFGIEPPADAELKDLSWIHLPGIKRLEIRRDKIVIERDPPPPGPS